MGIIQGLAGLQKLAEPREASGSGEKTVWLKVADGGQEQIYFLQELDKSSPRFSEKNGLALAAAEHVSPANYLVKALCSMEDEDRCYGCEQYRKDYTDDSVAKEDKGRWRARTRIYANVLVKPKDGDPYVAVMSQGFGPKGVGEQIVGLATENGAITDRSFTIKRAGEKFATTWTLTPSFKEDPKFDPEQYDVYDLSKVAVREVAYADQEAFFNEASQAKPETTATPTSVEWV